MTHLVLAQPSIPARLFRLLTLLVVGTTLLLLIIVESHPLSFFVYLLKAGSGFHDCLGLQTPDVLEKIVFKRTLCLFPGQERRRKTVICNLELLGYLYIKRGQAGTKMLLNAAA